MGYSTATLRVLGGVARLSGPDAWRNGARVRPRSCRRWGGLAEGEIGSVQRAARGRPVPGARLRVTPPAHVGGKRVFARAHLDFRFGVMRVVEPQLPFHILHACATLVQIGHREL